LGKKPFARGDINKIPSREANGTKTTSRPPTRRSGNDPKKLTQSEPLGNEMAVTRNSSLCCRNKLVVVERWEGGRGEGATLSTHGIANFRLLDDSARASTSGDGTSAPSLSSSSSHCQFPPLFSPKTSAPTSDASAAAGTTLISGCSASRPHCHAQGREQVHVSALAQTLGEGPIQLYFSSIYSQSERAR